MKPFDLFSTNHNDFHTMMDIAGVPIYVNGVPRRAFISNTRYLKEQNDKYISTDFEFKRGDIIYYDNRYWMVITQVGTPRHESYKGMIRQLEHDIIFNLYDVENRPSKYLLKVPSIVSQTSDFVAEYSRTTQFITITSEIHVIVQDNEKTRRIVELVNNGGRIIFGYRAYDIIGVSSTQKGVLDFTCTVSTFQEGDDRENNIPKPVPSDIEQYLDTSMYEIEGKDEEPSFNLPTGDELTEVDLAYYTTGGTLGWRREKKYMDFDGFMGYRLVVKSSTMFSTITVLDVVVEDTSDIPSYEIGTDSDLDKGYGWEVEISSIFTDGTVTVELAPITFSDYEIKQLPTTPPIW